MGGLPTVSDSAKKRVSFSLEVYGLPSVSLKASVLSQYLGESYYSLYISSNIYISMLVFSKKRGKSEIQKNVWGSIGGREERLWGHPH